MRILITALLCLGFASAHAQKSKTYRWVDENGVTHYSDQPNPDNPDPQSDTIDIGPTNVIKSRVPRTSAATRSPQQDNSNSDSEQSLGYSTLEVVNPQAEQTLWNIGAQLPVTIRVVPALRAGHGIVLYFDGQPVTESPQPATSFTLQEVYRGEHTLRAVVRGVDGRDLIGSSAITFYVQQSTVR